MYQLEWGAGNSVISVLPADRGGGWQILPASKCRSLARQLAGSRAPRGEEGGEGGVGGAGA